MKLRSPSRSSFATLRSDRPMSRWISCVRPLCLPRAASRSVRVFVERGSMPYSAVTQPRPLSFRKGGTRSSTDAVHSTRVSPNSTSTEPSAWRVKPRWMRTGRSASGLRPEGLMRLSLRALSQRGLELLDGLLDVLVGHEHVVVVGGGDVLHLGVLDVRIGA